MWLRANAAVFLVTSLLVTCLGAGIRPPYTEYAAMARYLVHKSNWTAMGTISSQSTLREFPMVNIISIADSPLNGPSTGRIYFLLTDLDFTGQDLKVHNKLTALFTEDQDLACTSNATDSMEPTCARVIIAGSLHKLDATDAEYQEADQWYTDRHPASINWRKTHQFYLCKLVITKIVLLDFYGGPHYVSIDDYYNANYADTPKGTTVVPLDQPTVVAVNRNTN